MVVDAVLTTPSFDRRREARRGTRSEINLRLEWHGPNLCHCKILVISLHGIKLKERYILPSDNKLAACDLL